MIQQNLWACLNKEIYEARNGTLIYEDDHTRYPEDLFPYGHNIKYSYHYKPIIQELLDRYDSTQNLDYLSDVGYVYILIGKYQEAINLYLEISNDIKLIISKISI